MKAPLALVVPGVLAALFAVEGARAEAPPVEIEVVEEDVDFFAEDEEEDDEGESGVKARADEAFEALEAEEAKKGRVKITRKRKGARAENQNENINQQVVNVVVVGEKETKTVAGAKVEAKPEVKAEPAPVADAPAESLPAVAAESKHPYGKDTWKSWWERPRGIAYGDLLVSYSVGGYAGGAHHGVGIEGMFSNWTGLGLTVRGGFYDRFRSDDHGGVLDPGEDLDFFFGGRSLTPELGSSPDRAFLHMEDLTLQFHLGSRRRFDFTPSVGVSHFGYWIRAGEQIERGGSALFRLGLAARWIHKRFFIGVEAGWYPYEFARYGLEDRGNGDLEAVKKDIDDPFDPKRAMVALNLGLSL